MCLYNLLKFFVEGDLILRENTMNKKYFSMSFFKDKFSKMSTDLVQWVCRGGSFGTFLLQYREVFSGEGQEAVWGPSWNLFRHLFSQPRWKLQVKPFHSDWLIWQKKKSRCQEELKFKKNWWRKGRGRRAYPIPSSYKKWNNPEGGKEECIDLHR